MPGLPKEFVSYARSYPYMLESLFMRETDRLRRSPEVEQWFAQNAPNATPQERDKRIQHQAALNANELGRKAFTEARSKYGVSQFTPQDLHQALAQQANERADSLANDPTFLRAAKGADTSGVEDTYRNKIVPEGVQRDVAMLSPYLPFDEQAPAKQQQLDNPAQAQQAAKGDEGAKKSAAPAQDDPLLRNLVGVMKGAGTQQKKNPA